LENFFARGIGEGRSCSAEEERADDADGLEGLAEDALFEGFDVDGDVWEFGHDVSLLLSQNGASAIVQRQKRFCGEGGPKAMVVRGREYNRLWSWERNSERLAGGTAKIFRRDETGKTAYTKIVQKYS